jgi:micrococcal nuclease
LASLLQSLSSKLISIMVKNFLLGLAVLASTTLFALEEITGKVVSVIDGNTIEVAASDGAYRILLHGIDSPEPGQRFANEARQHLEKVLLGKTVFVQVQGKDRWGNRLGVIAIEGNADPRFELLKEGLAWTSERNPLAELEAVKEEARENGKGLWKEENPTPPWIFRRQQSMMQPKSSGD